MLPFFSVLIALCAFTGGFLGFSSTREAQEQAAINSRRVVQNADNLGDGAAPASAPANAPGTVPIAAPVPNQATQQEGNPAVVVDPNPARPTPINPGDDLIPSTQGSASAAEIAAAENASATDAGNAATSDGAANANTASPPPGSLNPGSTTTSVPALW